MRIEKNMYFRRARPNKKTLDIAENIMDGNIFVHGAWPTVKLKNIKWDEDPFNDITWCFYLHSLDIVGYLMNAYETKADNKYLIKSKEFIESWIKANPSKEEQKSFFAWKDHSVANRVLNMIQFWMHYKDSEVYDEKFENTLKESLIQHGDYLVLDSNHTFINNHGIFQDRALMQLAIIFPDFKNSTKWYDKALNRFLKHVDKDVAESGMHLEHSDSYHIVVMNLFKSINQFLKHYNKKIDKLSNIIYKMEEHLAYILKPDGSIPMNGDSGPDRVGSILEKDIMNQEFIYVKSKGKRGKEPKLDIVYKDGGTAIVRNNWIFNDEQLYLRFLSAFHSKVHKHADDLSVLLTIGKTDFFVDSGKYNYQERDPYRKYFRSTMAHNTITVNNKTYPINPDFAGKSKITKYVDDPSFFYVQGEHEIYENTLIKRTLFYERNKEMILIYDEIESNEPKVYSQIFNLGEHINIIKVNNQRCLLESALNGKMIELRQVNKVENYKHYNGNKKPIRGWISTKFNEKKAINQLEFTNEAKDNDLQYRTIINTNIDKGAKYFSVNSSKDCLRIRVRYKNEEIKVYEIK